MPRKLSDGELHNRVTLMLTLPSGVVTGAAALLFGADPLRGAVGGVVGCLVGLLITPDLDLMVINHNRAMMMDIWGIGWIIGTLYIAIFLPYSLWFKHRGISHKPVLGTFTRILYLVPLVAAIMLLTKADIHIWIHWEWLCVLCGLCIADIGHYARDQITTMRKYENHR